MSDILVARAGRIHRELGFNVAMPVQPGHGPRRNRWPAYPGTDPMANVARAWSGRCPEVRAVIGWIEPQATAIALSGLSLGSAVAALAAGLDDRIDAVALYTPILGLNGMIARHLHRWGIGTPTSSVRRWHPTSSPNSPRSSTRWPSTIAPPAPTADRRAWHDQMAYRQSALALHERWGGRLHWHDGGHVGHLLSRSVEAQTERFPARVGRVPPVASAAVSGCLPVSTPWIRVAHQGARCTVAGVTAERIAEDSGFSSLLYRLPSDRRRHRAPTLIVKLPAQSEARGAMELLGATAANSPSTPQVAGRAPMAPAGVCRPDRGELRRLRAAPRGPGDWDNADHLAGLSVGRPKSGRRGLPVCIDGRCNRRILLFCSRFRPRHARRSAICWCPPSGPGWEIYREHTGATVPPVGRPFRRAVRRTRPVGAGGPDRTFDAAARRYPGRQHVLRRRPAPGCRLPVRLPRGRCQRHRLPRQPGPARRRPPWPRRGTGPPLPGSARGRTIRSTKAWRHYRFAVAYLMVLPVITLIGWDSLPGAVAAAVPDPHRPRGCRHRRHRRPGGVRVTRSARGWSSCTTWWCGTRA